MARRNILSFINELERAVFTTREIVLKSGKSKSTVTQSLKYLCRQGILIKVYRGIWALVGQKISPHTIIPFLLPRRRAYVSFITALHLHGIIEQIPQVITLASTSHTRTIRTKLGAFSIHRIAPSFYKGFDWYKGNGSFLIAEPEKALIDSLYVSVYKKKQYRFFPELTFPRSFDFSKARKWAQSIPGPSRSNVLKRLAEINAGAK